MNISHAICIMYWILYISDIFSYVWDICVYISLCVCSLSHSVKFDFLRPHGLVFARLLCPWDDPSRNTRVGCHFLLQGILLSQGLNLCLESPALAGGFFFTAEPSEKCVCVYIYIYIYIYIVSSLHGFYWFLELQICYSFMLNFLFVIFLKRYNSYKIIHWNHLKCTMHWLLIQ